MLLWDVRFVADGTGRIAFSKEPILEPISCESNNIKKYFDGLRHVLYNVSKLIIFLRTI